MKFGYQQPSHSFEKRGNIFQHVREIARGCEEEGYHSFWLMDHLIQIPLAGRFSQPILEPYTALGGIAAITDKIKIGTLCTCNFFRNPALVAKMGDTLDQVSDGRFWLGIGAGWFEREARMYGYQFQNVMTRFAMLEESLKIIRGAWTKRKFSFHGKYYDVRDLVCEPKPRQRPCPPIIVGGDGKKVTLRLVARYADGCNLTPRGKELEEELDALKKQCRNAGRPYTSVLKTKLSTVSFGADVDSGLEKSLAHKPRGMSTDNYWSSILAGRPRDMIEEIERFRALGIDNLIINFRGKYNAHQKHRFANEVISVF